MTQDDHMKLMHAGFRLIRADHHNLLIKVKRNYKYAWQILEKGFESKAAVDRRMKELQKDPKTITD